MNVPVAAPGHLKRRAGASRLVAVASAAAILVCLSTGCDAVDIGLGTCPPKHVVQDFQAEHYMGKWYEWKKYWQVFEMNGKCVTADYSLNNKTGVVTVKNSQVDERSGEPKSIEGTAVLVSPPEGKLAVTFPIPVVGNRTAPYWVIETDYSNFSLVYSCTAILGLVKFESAWALTRTANPSSNTIADIEKAIEKAELRLSSFQKTTQDCSS